MFSSKVELRVRYGETDRMGYMYYGNYPELFEVARVEALRGLGFPYKTLEDEGVLLPVTELNVRYHKPAFYDDLLIVEAVIPVLPAVRLRFDYRVLGPDGSVLTEATTTLVFVDKASGRPRKAPQGLLDALAPFYG